MGVRVRETTAEMRIVTPEGDGELAEEPSHHVAHEEERDEDGDEGDRQGQDGEADLLASP